MEYEKKLTEKLVQEILSQGVRDMPQNPGAQGYTERQIRQYFYVPEEKILRLIQEVETAIAQAVEDLEGSGTLVVDKALSNTSTNPVQNMVIADALDTKVDYETLGKAVNSLRQEQMDYTDGMFNGANKAVSYVNYSSMAQALNSIILTGGSPYNVGQNIMIVTLEVPDLWVSEIVEEHIDYQYVSDTDFIEELKANGSVQVGNYKLSALETQKVDLTEYEKTADVDEKLSGKLDKATGEKGWLLVYAILPNGENIVVRCDDQSCGVNNIVRYVLNTKGDIVPSQKGTILVNIPTLPYQAANKKFVEDTLAEGLEGKPDLPDTTYNWERVCTIVGNKLGSMGMTQATADGMTPLGNWTIMRTNGSGQLGTSDPTGPNHCANKKYVDEAVANAGKLYFHKVEIRGVDETVPKTMAINLNIISSKSESFGLETDYSKLFITKASGGDYSPDELISIRLGEFFTNDEEWGKCFGLNSMIDEKSIYISPLNNENLVISVNDTVTEI